MTKPTIEIEGLNRLVRELGKIDPELQDEIKSLNRELAEDVSDVAARKAPVRSGRLRKSIRAGASKRSGSVKAGKKAVPYAGPIHFGWPSRRIAPNTFLWDALDSRRDDVERQYVQRVEEIARRLDS